MKKNFILTCVIILSSIFTPSYQPHAEDKTIAIGEIDFLAYWSAAKLFVEGGNPYDPQSMEDVQKEVRSTERKASMMWNPPWVFPLTALVTVIPAHEGILLWFIASISLYVYCLATTLEIFNITDQRIRFWVFTLAIINPPLISCLYYGQVSVLLLLGWIIILRSILRGKNNLLSGFGIYLTLFKPHLLYLPYMVLLLRKKFSLLAFGGAVVILTSVLALLWNNQLFINNIHCLTTMPSSPVFWSTPTLGSYLMEYFSFLPYYVLRFASHLIGIIGALYLLRKYKKISLTEMLLLTTPLSLFCNSYGWMYDQLLLLPTIAFSINNIVVSNEKNFNVCYVTLAASIIYLLTSSHQEYGVWYPLFVLLLALNSSSLSQRQRTNSKF